MESKLVVRNLKQLIILFSCVVLLACGQRESESFDFEVAKRKWGTDGVAWTEAELQLLESGESLYRSNCSVCHARDGRGDIQLGGPALAGSPFATGPKSQLIQRILLGKKGSAMPAFADSLSDKEIAAVASYLRNAWRNQSADSVSANEVSLLR